MNNIKSLSLTNDGNMKRIAITYDVVDENGKVISGNKKINRIVTDSSVTSSIEVIETYAQGIIEEGNS